MNRVAPRPLARKIPPRIHLNKIRWRSAIGDVNRIIAYQERGATLREIAAAIGIPVRFVRAEILVWLGRGA